MKDIKLNESFTDIVLVNGEPQWVYGDEALLQRLVIRLNIEKGSYIHNTSLGIPYLTEILIRNPDLPVIRALFINEIEKDVEVERVLSLSLTLEDDRRTLRFQAEIQKIDENLVKLTSIDYNTSDQSSSTFLILTISPSTII